MMSHMSVLGACWVQAYFEERPMFGRKYLILEHAQQLSRKQHAEKEEKVACKRKIHVKGGRQA
jgi:hypothetical protein